MRIAVAAIVAFALQGVSAFAQIYRVAEMATEEIRALDRAKTVVLLPGGILEQHGPYLPSFADGYVSERVTETVAEAIVARPGWKALVFPMIPLGVGAANEIGGKYTFDGSYTVRSATLRAVYRRRSVNLARRHYSRPRVEDSRRLRLSAATPLRGCHEERPREHHN